MLEQIMKLENICSKRFSRNFNRAWSDALCWSNADKSGACQCSRYRTLLLRRACYF